MAEGYAVLADEYGSRTLGDLLQITRQKRHNEPFHYVMICFFPEELSSRCAMH